MQITGRGLELSMTEQHLDGAQIDTIIEQVCGKRVPHDMGAESSGNPRLLPQVLTDLPDA
jgi:hypothetical protein